MKDKMMDVVKKTIDTLKNNPMITSLIAFSIIALILILISIFTLQEYVVSVCVLMILEIMMAILLHKAEVWKHGILLVAHIIAGSTIGRIPVVIVCMIAYIAATIALHFMFMETKTSPKE